MSLRLKVAENQQEPLEVSFTIHRLRVNTNMQKQCLCPQRPVLLARATFIAARGSTAIKRFCCFNKISVLYYLLVELHPRVPVSATRGQYYYPQSHSSPLEFITAIQIHYLFNLR